MKYLLLILLIIPFMIYAGERHNHHTPDEGSGGGGVDTTTSEPMALSLPHLNNYGLLALASSGNQFDWGIPDKLQVSVSAAFIDGSQAMSFGVAQRFGAILVNGHLVTTLTAPGPDETALIISGTMHF